jgi:hypothetical protein
MTFFFFFILPFGIKMVNMIYLFFFKKKTIETVNFIINFNSNYVADVQYFVFLVSSNIFLQYMVHSHVGSR